MCCRPATPRAPSRAPARERPPRAPRAPRAAARRRRRAGRPPREPAVHLEAPEPERAHPLADERHVLLHVVVDVELLALAARVQHGETDHGVLPRERYEPYAMRRRPEGQGAGP